MAHLQQEQYSESEASSRMNNAVGKRLRVDGVKRTEQEYKQMLRLCEIENKELKDSLRYVEIQLAKTKDNLRQTTQNYENAQEEIQKCHEQIGRQANINHAQAQQIEDLTGDFNEVANSQKEIFEKSKIKIQQKQNEIDIREAEINRLKKNGEAKDENIMHLSTEKTVFEEKNKDLEEELEMKSGENNRLRQLVAEQEKAIQDLYCSRKGKGSLQIELDSLKADNERLLNLLKGTCEYQDMEDAEIFRAAATLNQQGADALNSTYKANMKARGHENIEKNKGKLNNDWIPTEAVTKLQEINKRYKGEMNERCISRILYDLNSIWRNIMRKENEAIKKKLTSQIQDLRRQVITKNAFDKGELQKEISRLKKELQYTNKQVYNAKRDAFRGKDDGNIRSASNVDLDQQMRMAEVFNNEKKIYEEEAQDLRKQLMAYEASNRENPAMLNQPSVTTQEDQQQRFMNMFTGDDSNSVVAANLMRMAQDRSNMHEDTEQVM